jgi:hypothetical protein
VFLDEQAFPQSRGRLTAMGQWSAVAPQDTFIMNRQLLPAYDCTRILVKILAGASWGKHLANLANLENRRGGVLQDVSQLAPIASYLCLASRIWKEQNECVGSALR